MHKAKIITIILITALSSSIIHLETRPMSIDTEKLTKAATDALDHAQGNLEIVTKSTCRNLLYLGCGLAGLSILTTTLITPIVSQQKSPKKQMSLTRKFLPYAIGLGSGTALLATSCFGLK